MRAGTRPVTRALVLGVVAGMRSLLPLGLLAFAARRGRFARRAGPPLSLLRSPVALPIFGLFACGELVADKLPFVPSRHELGPLLGRTVSGGVAGAAIARDAGGSAALGALVGAVAGGLAADGAYHLRATVDRVTGLPDPLVGAAEDLLAIALGLWTVHVD